MNIHKNLSAIRLFFASAIMIIAFSFGLAASAATMADYGTATLQQGSVGAQVINVQGTLNWPACGGYNLNPDGIFGSGTRAAVRSFQSSHGLVADGVVGTGTKAALAACLNAQIAIVAASR